ncbi:uncharacterized protein YALI1_F10660g [Yarrowia lipolytica]|uniref:Amidase domain-containing protein n=1 Tax=Yarrowia lipolytica TaxID=4952 RepID=A0A1D8NMD6_YARLL|nr:hypothetical protein YALI1_F10660g [Yarrowia lipolytica]
MVLTFEIAREKFLKIRDDSIAELDKVFPPPEDSRHHEVPAKLPKNSIPVFQEMLAHDDAAIINSDPIELLDQLAKAKVSAVAVAGAFLRAAVIAQTLTNCLTELLPREALETAQKLDDYLKSTGKPVGPLHGLPVSVKEMVGFKGRTCHFSVSSKINNITPDNAIILKVLYKAGANPYCRIPVPNFSCRWNQSRLSMERLTTPITEISRLEAHPRVKEPSSVLERLFWVSELTLEAQFEVQLLAVVSMVFVRL